MSENTVLAFRGGRLIDGTGREPVENVVVVIEGSKIIGVGKKEAGAIMAMATDYLGTTSMMHGTNAKEMELLAKYCGYSPMEAIKAATWGGSMACGLEDQIGTIEARKFADLIIVDGDPLKDITIFQDHDRIKMVLKNGKTEVNRGLKIPN